MNIIKVLTEKKLMVWDFSSKKMGVEHYIVSKKDEVGGNIINGFKRVARTRTEKNFEVSSPVTHIKKVEGGWMFTHWEFCPGPGPGDFEIIFQTIEEVVEDVQKYYFGKHEEFEKKKNFTEQESEADFKPPSSDFNQLT